jgi:hypothetical protein
MLMIRKFGAKGYVAALASLAVMAAAPRAKADTTIEQGSAILVWPKIVAQTDPTRGPLVDTLVEISNLDTGAQTAAHCFYVNANSHCANTGGVCTTALDCAGPGGSFGSCTPGWIEVDFDVILTPNQPLAWSAVEGLGNSDIPCPGNFGSICSGNQGTRVPPVTESPFIGELKCIQVSPVVRVPEECTQGSTCQNDLVGKATIFELSPAGLTDGREYNAVGFQTSGDNNGDRVLNLGGADAEYEPCHDTLIFDHLFDGATDPISGTYQTESELTLVPCTEDFLTQTTDAFTAQFIVYNEFEQRFSTSRQVRCLLDSQISLIDTSQSSRSIFNAAVAGTIAGNTRIHGVGSGLLGVAVLNYNLPAGSAAPQNRGGGAYSLDGFAFRDEGDRIRVP